MFPPRHKHDVVMPLWKMLSDQHGGNPVAHTSRAFVRTRGAGSVRSSTGLKHESGPRKSAREASVTWLLPFGPTCWTDRAIAQRGISVYAQVSVDAIASTPSTTVYGPEHRNASTGRLRCRRSLPSRVPCSGAVSIPTRCHCGTRESALGRLAPSLSPGRRRGLASASCYCSRRDVRPERPVPRARPVPRGGAGK